ncbi:MAG: ABC-2 transporter permease [bacterium]
MWRLLQAEFDYHKTRLRLALLAGFIFFLVTLTRDWDGVYGLQGVTMVIFYAAMIIVGSYDDREKRDRLQALLPVALPDFSASRLLFIILLQSAFFALWLIVYLVRHVPHDVQALWSMLSLQATMLTVVNLFIIHHDLGYYETRRYRLVFYAALLVIFAGLFSMEHHAWVENILSFGPSKSKSPSHALVSNIIAISSFSLCHRVFMRRKSFLS